MGNMEELFTRAQLDEMGWTDHSLNDDLRSKALVRLRRGYYSQLADPTIHSIRASSHACSEAAIISHSSAAWLHGYPVRRESLDHVHLTRSSEYQRHWGPAIVWLGAGGGMSGSLVRGPGVACLGAAWGS